MPLLDQPKVSFIVPLYNRLDCTQALLESFIATIHSVSFELIFVNDCSDDGSREFLDARRSERIVVLHNEKRMGYAKSVNRGAVNATGEFLGLLNNDLVLTDGWLEPMLECFNKKLKVGTVGNIQRNINTRRIDHAGIIFDLVGLPDHYGKNYPFIPTFDYRDFPAVTGACMLIRRSLFEEMQGFDESYLNGCEDVDLCLRIGQKGYRNIVAGQSTVWHHVSASPGRRDNDQSNNKKLLKRWGEDLKSHGQRNWPFQYLMRYWNKPWLFNGTKLIDALLRIVKLRSGDSPWAIEKRRRILAHES
ncbi:MAG: glycosyltransferase family 2 protein [Verrucomicrobia bacterium]|nr:glycosyltransferase family 2 protein [Verrucomicrobiota bacterium]